MSCGGMCCPNALVPIVTIVGLQFAALVTGTIVIENVFYLPGLGRLMFQSIANRDLITVQALVMLFAAFVVTANFLVDIAYVLIDPRLRRRGHDAPAAAQHDPRRGAGGSRAGGRSAVAGLDARTPTPC